MPGPEGAESFYYADGEKIPLIRSQRLVAVRDANGGFLGAGDGDGAPAMSGELGPTIVMELPEHGLTVVAMAPDAAGAQGPMGAAMLGDTESGPPVYETTEAGTEALIPIGEVIVRFREDVTADDRDKLLRKRKLSIAREDFPEPGTLLVTVPDGVDAVEAANALHEAPEVEYAEPNFAVLTPRVAIALEPPPGSVSNGGGAVSAAPGPAFTPTDPGFASQWALKKIRAPEAWDISRGSGAISVAIIDEGCDLSHEDLLYKTPGYDAYQGDDDPTPLPADGHGTSCAGIAAARANNGKGGVGVAPDCRVMPIRIAKGVGGGFWDTTSAKVADGIRKAVDRGADVLSNSYGVGPSTAVTNAFTYAQTNGRGGRGCPIAAATGNGDVLGVIYPARLSPSIKGFLAVGASNEWDQRKSKTSLDGETWWGSNFGPEVDIVAPGVHIYTTDIMGTAGYGTGNYIPAFNGTSSATPHVAGLMGLILSVDPELRSWEVEDIVKLTADDLGVGGRDQESGFGRINARRAVEAASKIWYEVTIALEFLGAGQECYMRADVRMYNPGINSVRLDGLTLTSHDAAGGGEIDRFEYRPNPGNVLAARSGQDVRLRRILLKANGNRASYSYRWNVGWSYTFWRPSAPATPLSAPAGAGAPGTGSAEGGASGSGPAVTPVPAIGARDAAAPDGDRVVLDRGDRRLTIELNL